MDRVKKGGIEITEKLMMIDIQQQGKIEKSKYNEK